MSDSSQYTPDTVARRLQIAQSLLADPKRPVTHWAEGLNELAKGAVGGYLLNKSEREQKEGQSAQNAALLQFLGGGQGAPSAPSQVTPAAPTSASPGDAIASIESGGNYGALGPMTKGDRAYGKYQVMGSNVGPWTKAYVGQEMTPEQFIANPQAQDAVFKGEFGRLSQKYGPEGAARAWFAGEGGMNNPNAKDVLGTSVSDYSKKFTAGGGGSPVAEALMQPAPQGAAPVASDPRSQIAAMLQSKNPFVQQQGRQLASSIVQKQLEGEKPTDEMREYQLYRQQGGKDSFFDYKAGLKKAGAQNVSVNNTVNPILKGVGDRFNEGMEVAKASIPQIQGIHEARRALDQGAITGAAADPKLFGAKVANLFGLGTDAAANTEVLRSSIGNSVLAKAKTLGANPSNADRDYIEKVVGGSIALEEASIRRLLDMQEKWARDSIRRANAEGKKLLTSQPKELENVAGLLSVEEPDTYENFLKANPMAPANPATVPGGAKVRKFNPASGRIE